MPVSAIAEQCGRLQHKGLEAPAAAGMAGIDVRGWYEPFRPDFRA